MGVRIEGCMREDANGWLFASGTGLYELTNEYMNYIAREFRKECSCGIDWGSFRKPV